MNFKRIMIGRILKYVGVILCIIILICVVLLLQNRPVYAAMAPQETENTVTRSPHIPESVKSDHMTIKDIEEVRTGWEMKTGVWIPVLWVALLVSGTGVVFICCDLSHRDTKGKDDIKAPDSKEPQAKGG